MKNKRNLKIISQMNIPLQQSVEDYNVNGPAKIENSHPEHFTNEDSRVVLETGEVRDLYNTLKGEGASDVEAWRGSKAKLLPTEEQLRLLREIKESNPNFYQRSDVKIVSPKLAEIEEDLEYWDFTYSKDDVIRIL